ncbi:S-formylglutathione hydrolase FrmB [Actinomadura meyerae]|uniref:Acyl-CoA:diacylglycerol acyltransferase n=1 Tax=Actinomadura meyerae TaxID=240840 RepID=A0A239LHL4_9ACTN|nr:alpha/beta hydrolase-fold protein [Actinomadura meyerae]SNT29333.1 S-formylglutathione hydrolase FrmB [Actinomadura meyerae]
MITRRALLLGGLAGAGAAAATGGTGYALVENGVLPGKVRLDRALGRCGDVPAPPAASVAVQRMAWRSAHRRTAVTATVVPPAPGRSLRGLPVVLALHGSGETGAGLVAHLALDRYLPDAVANGGVPPFALVAVDGGPDTYWHARANGDDPIGMLVDELLPRLRERGARTGRVGVVGWSMGGYGALVLTRRLGAARTAAAVASSPALFASYEDARSANPRAFDGAADFARNDVFAALDALKGVPLRVDCGASDPFAAMARRLRDRVRPAGAVAGGCHDAAFWRSRLRAQLAFLGHHLDGS